MGRTRIGSRLQAAAVALFACCMLGICPVSISAGEPECLLMGTLPLAPAGAPALKEAQGIAVFARSAGEQEAEDINRLADLCIEKLNDRDAIRMEPSGAFIKTGIVADFETAKDIYQRSRERYYGNIGYHMAYERLPDGRVSLYLKPQHGTAKQAYEEHCAAKARLLEIASQFDGADAKAADDIFRWVCANVAYAEAETLDRIRETPDGETPDYNGIHATTYTAAMDGITTCDGYSGMLLALYEMKGIPAAKVQNRDHAYVVVFLDGRETAYDATNGLSGNAGEAIERYGKFYYPQTVTYGYRPLAESIP